MVWSSSLELGTTLPLRLPIQNKARSFKLIQMKRGPQW